MSEKHSKIDATLNLSEKFKKLFLCRIHVESNLQICFLQEKIGNGLKFFFILLVVFVLVTARLFSLHGNEQTF